MPWDRVPRRGVTDGITPRFRPGLVDQRVIAGRLTRGPTLMERLGKPDHRARSCTSVWSPSPESADVWIPAPARLAWAERKSSRSRFVREAGIRSINPLGYLGYRVPPWSSPEPIAPWDRPSPIGLRCGGSGVGLVRGLEPSPPEGPARLRRRCEPGAAKATAARLTGGWRVCYRRTALVRKSHVLPLLAEGLSDPVGKPLRREEERRGQRLLTRRCWGHRAGPNIAHIRQRHLKLDQCRSGF
jgi:hypothetical protein